MKKFGAYLMQNKIPLTLNDKVPFFKIVSLKLIER